MLSNTNPLREKLFSPSIWRAFYVHFLSFALLSWWIIPLLNNFDYMGGLPWKSENEHGHSFEFVLRSLLSGDLFDHERKIPFITLGFLAGLACICSSQLKDIGHLTERQTLLIWLGLLFSVTFFLFLGRTFSGPLYNLIPFHKELEVFRYIIGLQFCGLLLMAVTLARILYFLCASLCRISKAHFQSKNVLIVLMLVFPPIYLSSQLQYINARLSMIEIEGFSGGLEKLKAYPKDGRLLASKFLGEFTFLASGWARRISYNSVRKNWTRQRDTFAASREGKAPWDSSFGNEHKCAASTWVQFVFSTPIFLLDINFFSIETYFYGRSWPWVTKLIERAYVESIIY